MHRIWACEGVPRGLHSSDRTCCPRTCLILIELQSGRRSFRWPHPSVSSMRVQILPVWSISDILQATALYEEVYNKSFHQMENLALDNTKLVRGRGLTSLVDPGDTLSKISSANLVEQAQCIFYILQQYSNLTSGEWWGERAGGVGWLLLERRGRWERTRDVIIINPERGCLYTTL